jgi:predicted PhzF superfamily epimerase YddE/YHI9
MGCWLPVFMKYRYYICDVFTETRFGGNQLAVLTCDANHLRCKSFTDAKLTENGVAHRFFVSATE